MMNRVMGLCFLMALAACMPAFGHGIDGICVLGYECELSGDTCTGDWDCYGACSVSGDVCNVDGDCPTGETCDNGGGYCSPITGSSLMVCDEHADCDPATTGEWCTGFCVDDGRLPGQCSVTRSTQCFSGADCPGGEVCEFLGRCTNSKWDCYHDDECPTGETCQDRWLVHGGQVSGAGASLFVDFFKEPSHTNDWINPNPDYNPLWGYDPNGPPFVDTLAAGFSPGSLLSTWFMFQYRSVGSTNGFNEFVANQTCGSFDLAPPSEAGIFQRNFLFANLGQIQTGNYPVGTTWDNPGGTPHTPCEIEFSFLDVPSLMAIHGPNPTVAYAQSSNGENHYWSDFRDEYYDLWGSKPGEDNYGLNPIVSSTGFVANYKNLCRDCDGDGIKESCLNSDTDDPDENTIFDYVAAWTVISFIATTGVGFEKIDMSDLQYLYLTGRMANGENLVGATRDFGSGTRAGSMNSIGVDPTWGRGDNVMNKIKVAPPVVVGPTHQPTNLGGSSIMEEVVENRRLAIGYTGICGGSRAGADAAAGKYEILGVRKNIATCDSGGLPACTDPNGYVRPYMDNMLDNCDPCTGWQIAGLGSFVVRGNRDTNRPPMVCEDDMRLACTSGADCPVGVACVVNPRYVAPLDPGEPMDNQAMADYLNNILDSSEDFELPLPPVQQNFMPGQWLAGNFITPPAVDCLSRANDGVCFDDTPENTVLQEWVRANGQCDVYEYGHGNIANQVPDRLDLTGTGCYSDGSQDGDYIYWDNAASLYKWAGQGQDLSERNKVMGDFTGDFARTAADVTPMVTAMYTPRAWQQTANGAGDPGNLDADNSIPEVLGDFDGDGNFCKEDLRYWMDGLHMVGGIANRKAGAIAIDTALQNAGRDFPWRDTSDCLISAAVCLNDGDLPAATLAEPTAATPAAITGFLVTGEAYDLGDFRADVAGRTDRYLALNYSGGANPTGWDGIVDDADLDYVCRNMGDWTDLNEAVFIDYSADMNGDGTITQADVDEVLAILNTTYCDVNLDQVVDAADQAIMLATIADVNGCNADGSCGWADGDTNCDGYVDATDLGACFCPDTVTIVASTPVDGAVDARAPITGRGFGEAGDPIVIDLGTGNTGLGACLAFCQTPADPITSQPVVVDNMDGTYAVTLTPGLPEMTAATIRYAGDGSFVTLYHHPSNVDGSSVANLNDITVLIDLIASGGAAAYQADIDFSGTINLTDLLAEIDLLNGQGYPAPYLGTALPDASACQ